MNKKFSFNIFTACLYFIIILRPNLSAQNITDKMKEEYLKQKESKIEDLEMYKQTQEKIILLNVNQ